MPSSSGPLEAQLIKLLRVFGAACGAATIVCAVFSFILGGFIDPRNYIADAYLIIFGVLMIIAELRLVILLKYVYFLQHYAGLGLFYIFVGGLLLNEKWWMFLVAILLIAVGIVYLVLGCACRKMVDRPILPSDQQRSDAIMASDDPRWENSQSGKAYAMSAEPAYGGFTPTLNVSSGGLTVGAGGGTAGTGGGAGGWGINLTPQQAMAAASTAQSMGLTADHMVQGAQFASKYQGAYGP